MSRHRNTWDHLVFIWCFRRCSNEALDKWIATRKNGRQAINFVQVSVRIFSLVPIIIIIIIIMFKCTNFQVISWKYEFHHEPFNISGTGQWTEVFSEDYRRPIINTLNVSVETEVSFLRMSIFSQLQDHFTKIRNPVSIPLYGYDHM